MTLSTNVGFRGNVDAADLHRWVNENLLKAPDAHLKVEGPNKWTEWHQISNAPGQGFSAWVITTHNNGDLLVYLPEDTSDWDEDDIAYHATYPTGMTAVVDFDTTYGYTGPLGEGCTELHAMFIARLYHEYALPRGLEIVWQNEYSGAWNEGLEGFSDFFDGGDDARTWFKELVVPYFNALEED